MQQHQQAVSVLFAGNSQMAKVMRSQTWSQTAVGAVEHWSLTLQTAIRILLSACQPMVCVWGSDRTLFYNDAWADLWLPEPRSLTVGQSLRQLAAPWSTLIADVEQVWQAGQPLTSQATVAQAPGQCPGTTIACSYSPLWDEAGRVAGVFVSGCPVAAERSPRSSRTAAPQSEVRGRHLATDLQLVTDAVPVLIALIDRQERYQFANRTYETWFGLSPEAVCQRTICEVVGVAAYQMIRPYIRQALAGATVRFEQEVPFHQGGSRYVEVTYVPRREASGTVSGFVALISDISDRKRTEKARAQAETALRESENRFRRMANFSPIMIWISDPTGAGTWFNQQWYDFTGQTVEAALGDGWLTALHPEDAARIHETCAAANQQRASVRLEYRLRGRDGEYRWVLDVAMPRFDGAGNYLGYIGSIVDIHDRKQAEAERERLFLELTSERARFETVLRQLPAGVMIADAASDCLLLTNEQTRQMLRYDYKVGAALPTYQPLEPFQAFRLTGEPYTADEYPLARSLRTGEVISDEAMVIRFPDHSEIVIEVNASPIFNSQGHITAAVSIFQDVTARQQAEAALRQSEEQARLAIRVGRLGTWRYHLQQDRVEMDARMLEIWGEAAPAPLPLGTVIQRIHPADRELVRQAVERALSPHSTGTYEADYRIRWDDGTVRWISANGQVQFEGEGANRQPVNFFGTALDITDRKQAEAALREQEQRYRYIFEAVNVPIWEEDFTQVKAAIDQLKAAGVQDFCQYFGDHPEFVAAAVNWVQLQDVNQAALRMFEAQDKAELLNSLARIFVPETWAIFEAELLAIAAEEPFFAAETTVQTLQGKQLNVFVSVTFPQHGAYHRVLVSLLDITPHKQSEAALQAAEERLRVALKNAPITVFNQDRDLRYTWIHKPALYQAEAVLGRQDQDLLSPADAAVVTAIKQHALNTATSVRHEVKVTHAGLDHYFDLTVEPLRDTAGAIIGITGATVDISTQKRTELKLRESEERLRLAMEGAQMATWDVDLKTGKAIWSDRHFEMLGYEPTANGEAAEAMWKARIHPEDRDRVLQEWQQAQVEHRFYRAEYRVLRADTGAICWLEGLGNFRYDAHGQAVRSIGVVFDIDDRKREEAVRQQVENALREQRAILAAVLRQAADAIIVCDANGQLTFVNQEARRLAQLDPEGTTLEVDLLAWGQGYDTAGHLVPLEEYSIAQALRGETSNAQEFRMVRQDGSYYDILISAAPLWTDSRQIMGAVANFMDISDRKQAEAALQESEERFRNLADNISQFAWMADPTGWIFWYNQRWFEFTGTTLAAMAGWGWQAVHHPDHVDRVVESFRCSIATGAPWEDTFPLRGQDGCYRWFLSRALPIRDEAGNILRWFGTNTDITALKQAEEALAQREAELSLVTNAAPALIAFVDADQCYRFNNHRYEDWVGLSAAELHGKHLRTVFGDQYAEIQPYVERVLAGEEVTYERQLVHLNGTQRDVRVIYVPRFTPVGEVEGFVALINDISDRKRAEAALRDSEDRLRMAIESAQLGVWDWNLVTHELTWDAGCKAMFGLPPEAPTNLDIFFNALHPEDRERMMQVVQESLNPANGGHYDAEYRVIGIEDGMERWILAKGQVYFDGDREARRFTGTVLDITDQKRFEQALMDSEVQARARAEELTAIMETTPAAIWIAHDPDCHEMTANKTAYELMGMLPGTATTATAVDGSNPLPFRQCREGEDIPPQDLPMQQAARLRQPVMGDLEFVFPDGTTRYLYGKAVPLYGPDGDVRGTIGGFVDITALKLSERAREQLLQRERQARAEAEKASRIKDEFLAILSHELRSPLNPILGWSTLLRSGRLDGEKTAIALETIERNAKLQIQLIDDLLDISRIIRGKLHLSMAPTPLENTIVAAIETVRLAAEAKSIRIHRHLDPECQVLGDAARLQQIVWNLLSNAVKFTPEGGQVDIYLAPVTEPLPPRPQETALPQADPALAATVTRYAQIQVRDTGKGIHADFLPHVFEHFRQADSTTTRNFGGLGLGLAIVRYLVELHGGTVQADSPGAGQGAVFTVRLPLLKERSPEMPASERPLRSDTEPLPLQHLQILLVDDDPDTRDFLALTLDQQGAAVTAVTSAPEALQAFKRTPFDLLISDIGMPNMDGYTLMRHIRHQTAATGGHIPAIALTAYAGEANQRQALAAGFDCHIAKPVDLDKLIPTIVELIQGRT